MSSGGGWRLALPSLALLLAGCTDTGTTVAYTTSDSYESVQVGAVRRWFRLHIPDRPTPGPAAPLILAYHGYGQSAEQLEGQTALNAAADAAGAIVVYPEAYYGTWDVNGEAEELFQVYDIAFARAIIAAVKGEHVIDSRRVVAVGLSNGAVFVHRLGCEASDEIAGIVAVAGAMLRPIAGRCQPIRPISALLMLGTEDGTFPVDGNSLLLSLEEDAAFWATRASCGSSPQQSTIPDQAGDGTTITLRSFTKCREGNSVRTVEIAGGGHSWPGTAHPPNPEFFGRTTQNYDASRAIMEFAREINRP